MEMFKAIQKTLLSDGNAEMFNHLSNSDVYRPYIQLKKGGSISHVARCLCFADLRNCLKE